jgi:methionyl-tRNA formyltransferase
MFFFRTPSSKKRTPEKTNIVFFGTPEFSAIILEALIKKKYSIGAVVTQPDKASGRNKLVLPSPVKEVAGRNAIPVLQPKKINGELVEELKKYNPEIIIVAAFGKIFPSSLLNSAKYGCLNVHASVLPLYRGASPIQNAILNGDQTTGISLIKMNEGLDTGPVYAKQIIALEADELYQKVSERLAHTAATLLLETLPLIFKGTLTPIPQDEKEATHCQLIEKEDGRLYWNETAREIFNRYRAFSLWPGVYTYWKRKDTLQRLKLLRIRLHEDLQPKEYTLGEVFLYESGVFIKTALGSIELLEVQLEGKNPLSIRDFTRGSSELIGSVLQ